MTGAPIRIRGDWLSHPGTQAVLAMLTDAGHVALAVGGCVRNALLDRPVADVDIATSAEPAQVIALAEAAGLRSVPTGIDHGTVTVIAHDRPFEVTTFRRDVETFGRHARVAFDADLHTDAARRDFTINALYVQADGTVIDPLGGLPDIAGRRVRFVGDAATRIAEDALRILRFFRFHAHYADPEGGIDPDGLAACAEGADGLDKVSVERITAEMRKLLSAPDPAPAVASMTQAGILAHVLPGTDPALLPILVHLEPEPGDWILRLAALGDGSGLRLSRAEERTLSSLREAAAGTLGPAALGHVLGPRGRDALVLRAAMMQTPLPAGYADALERGRRAVFPLVAADLMPALSGPALGEALGNARAHWLENDLRPDRIALLSLLGLV